MAEKTFNLTWNNHLANLSGLFEGLYKSGSLTDTTLACQGGMLRAHRLVLAACSPYFERVFKEHYGEQPILILKGVSVEEMECLLDFMYRGSIDVAEEHLTSLIRTATDLEIRGLSPDHRIDSVHSHARVETRMQRRHIETRVQTTEYIKESTSDPFLPKQSLIDSVQDQVKMEEIEVEDDPMVIDHDDSFDSPLPPPNEQIRHIPPPMFKRETRFKGQKRVSVGRPMKSHDVTESSKTKDRVSMREMSHEEFVEEAVQMSKVKEESMFNSNSSDPTEPTVQLNEDIYEHERESTDSPTCGTKTADSFAIDEPNASGPKKKMENAKRGTTTGEGETKEGSRSYMKSDKAQYKPFSCDLCTLAFTRASHLARHRRVHTGERPFACTLCPRMFARQDKLKQHLDSHLQWPKRRALTNLTSGGVHSVSAVTTKGKRGRPRKITLEQSAMEEFMKFGEFSSLLNKSQPVNSTVKNEQASTGFPKQVRDPKMKEQRVQEEEEEEEEEEGEQTDDSSLFKNTDSYGCQVENGQDIV